MSAPDTAVAVLSAEPIGTDELVDGTHVNTFSTSGVVDELAERRGRRSARTPDFRSFVTRSVRVLLAGDAAAAVAAVALTGVVADALSGIGAVAWVLAGCAAMIVWPIVILASRGYRRSRLGSRSSLQVVLRAAAIVIVSGALPAAWFGLDWMLAAVAIGAPAAAIGSTAVRVVVGERLRREQRSGGTLRSVIMVGGPEAVDELCRAVERERGMGMRIAGVCVPAGSVDRAKAMGLPVLGDIEHVAEAATELNCDAVAVTGADATRQSFLRQLAWSLEGVDVDLFVHPGLIDVARPRMHIQPYSGLPMLHVEQPHFTGLPRHVKRATDIVLTSLGLLFISPLLAAVAIAVKLEDRRGPVIFKQSRVGIDGKPFTMYKFRSMVVDAEKRLAELKDSNEGAGPLFKISNDPRVTRVGHFLRRYSLDELPQLFNVLGGSMSLVGPRPPLQSEVDAYAEDIRRRLKVMPGVTGLWQVSGRSMLSWEESVRLDLRYVENWSFGLDLQILARTAYAVLAKKGAY
ncbi:sugar transferase [Microlunatus soli]|uniref:Undecaprenyl-phosphate galactose phosphotransferase, WbaP/exopolysaccharide biosynthesis polyprenyl glycosylphosphotransferase n=1 Tax=Microlunatus soli TaxID=630515 RepID=A0A1H1SQG3_9ACTN|nr:sugar transferase [Microlunatus soli]SDS49966.1 Undecaprenyl-phosphate galactose phosphotransferase, WbaP/exopolysaccharide biosynthesis polyprenyl glycosylphosphotransferase [Microlunatus soli]